MITNGGSGGGGDYLVLCDFGHVTESFCALGVSSVRGNGISFPPAALEQMQKGQKELRSLKKHERMYEWKAKTEQRKVMFKSREIPIPEMSQTDVFLRARCVSECRYGWGPGNTAGNGARPIPAPRKAAHRARSLGGAKDAWSLNTWTCTLLSTMPP